MRRLILVTILILSLGILPALAGSDVPAFEETDCWFDDIEGADPECGFVVVPEDHNDPDNGNTINLAVAIFRAEDDAEADPVIYLEGGPGGSPLEIIAFTYESSFAPFQQNRDVIVFDQRGVGYSEPALDCDEYSEFYLDNLDEELSLEDATELTIEAFEACRDRLLDDGVNLEFYNSAQNAADINAIREALGYDEVNLYGISYGTRLALTALRDFGDDGWIRSVIIDSVYPPQVAELNTVAGLNADRAFNTLFEGCAADADCDATYPDLRDVLFDTVDALNEDPETIDILDFNTGDTLPALITGDALLGLLFSSMYATEFIPFLPNAIYEASEGDLSFFGTLLSSQLFQLDVLSYGMYYSVQCAEDVALTPQEDIDAVYDELPEELINFVGGETGFEDRVAFCESWGVPVLDDIENEPVESDIPALVIAGQYDPITPPEWAELAADTLENSFFYVFPANGHGVTLSNECAMDIAVQFVDDPSEEPDSDCLDDETPPEFVIAGEIADFELVEFENEDVGIASVVPDGWEPTEQLGTLIYTNPDNPSEGLIFFVLPINADQAVDTLSAQFDLEEIDQIEAGGIDWTLYNVNFQGFPGIMAVAEVDGVTYAVLLLTDDDSLEPLTEALLIPVLEAFEVLE